MTSSSNSDQVILATGGYDHTIKLWQVNSGVCRHTAQHTESVSNFSKIYIYKRRKYYFRHVFR